MMLYIFFPIVFFFFLTQIIEEVDDIDIQFYLLTKALRIRYLDE